MARKEGKRESAPSTPEKKESETGQPGPGNEKLTTEAMDIATVVAVALEKAKALGGNVAVEALNRLLNSLPKETTIENYDLALQKLRDLRAKINPEKTDQLETIDNAIVDFEKARGTLGPKTPEVIKESVEDLETAMREKANQYFESLKKVSGSVDEEKKKIGGINSLGAFDKFLKEKGIKDIDPSLNLAQKKFKYLERLQIKNTAENADTSKKKLEYENAFKVYLKEKVSAEADPTKKKELTLALLEVENMHRKGALESKSKASELLGKVHKWWLENQSPGAKAAKVLLSGGAIGASVLLIGSESGLIEENAMTSKALTRMLGVLGSALTVAHFDRIKALWTGMSVPQKMALVASVVGATVFFQFISVATLASIGGGLLVRKISNIVIEKSYNKDDIDAKLDKFEKEKAGFAEKSIDDLSLEDYTKSSDELEKSKAKQRQMLTAKKVAAGVAGVATGVTTLGMQNAHVGKETTEEAYSWIKDKIGGGQGGWLDNAQHWVNKNIAHIVSNLKSEDKPIASSNGNPIEETKKIFGAVKSEDGSGDDNKFRFGVDDKYAAEMQRNALEIERLEKVVAGIDQDRKSVDMNSKEDQYMGRERVRIQNNIDELKAKNKAYLGYAKFASNPDQETPGQQKVKVNMAPPRRIHLADAPDNTPGDEGSLDKTTKIGDKVENINQHAVVHAADPETGEGGGVTYSYLQQLKADPALCEKLGIDHDKLGSPSYAGKVTAELGVKTGYLKKIVNPDGSVSWKEIQVLKPEKVAYVLKAEGGEPITTEFEVIKNEDGTYTGIKGETNQAGSKFEADTDDGIEKDYETYDGEEHNYYRPRQIAPRDTGFGDEKEGGGDEKTSTNEPQKNKDIVIKIPETTVNSALDKAVAKVDPGYYYDEKTHELHYKYLHNTAHHHKGDDLVVTSKNIATHKKAALEELGFHPDKNGVYKYDDEYNEPVKPKLKSTETLPPKGNTKLFDDQGKEIKKSGQAKVIPGTDRYADEPKKVPFDPRPRYANDGGLIDLDYGLPPPGALTWAELRGFSREDLPPAYRIYDTHSQGQWDALTADINKIGSKRIEVWDYLADDVQKETKWKDVYRIEHVALTAEGMLHNDLNKIFGTKDYLSNGLWKSLKGENAEEFIKKYTGESGDKGQLARYMQNIKNTSDVRFKNRNIEEFLRNGHVELAIKFDKHKFEYDNLVVPGEEAPAPKAPTNKNEGGSTKSFTEDIGKVKGLNEKFMSKSDLGYARNVRADNVIGMKIEEISDTKMRPIVAYADKLAKYGEGVGITPNQGENFGDYENRVLKHAAEHGKLKQVTLTDKEMAKYGAGDKTAPQKNGRRDLGKYNNHQGDKAPVTEERPVENTRGRRDLGKYKNNKTE